MIFNPMNYVNKTESTCRLCVKKKTTYWLFNGAKEMERKWCLYLKKKRNTCYWMNSTDQCAYDVSKWAIRKTISLWGTLTKPKVRADTMRRGAKKSCSPKTSTKTRSYDSFMHKIRLASKWRQMSAKPQVRGTLPWDTVWYWKAISKSILLLECKAVLKFVQESWRFIRRLPWKWKDWLWIPVLWYTPCN